MPDENEFAVEVAEEEEEGNVVTEEMLKAEEEVIRRLEDRKLKLEAEIRSMEQRMSNIMMRGGRT